MCVFMWLCVCVAGMSLYIFYSSAAEWISIFFKIPSGILVCPFKFEDCTVRQAPQHFNQTCLSSLLRDSIINIAIR